MSDRWRELFKHVVAEAGRLGLEVNMNNDAGWNGSGGPWVKPELSMQKVVASETEVAGPKHVEASLPQPKTVAGFYRDIAVLAFPTPGNYRIPDIQIKAAYQVGGAPPIATQQLPKEMVIRPRADRESQPAHEPARAIDLGSSRGPVDHFADRAHQHRHAKRSGAGQRLRAGMRQAQQGGHRGPFPRHDGPLDRRRGTCGGQGVGGHARRQLGERLAELDRPHARGIPGPARLRPRCLFCP